MRNIKEATQVAKNKNLDKILEQLG